MTDLQKDILRLIQIHGAMSRKGLTEKLNVTAAAMSQNTKYLLDIGLIESFDESHENRAGRKEILLRIKKDSLFFLGIELDSPLCYCISNAIGECQDLVYFDSLDDMLISIQSLCMSSIYGIAISKKGFYSIDVLKDEEQKFIHSLKKIHPEVTIHNNIGCLAYSYKYSHPLDENFTLIKYGPGIGSACFIGDTLFQSSKYPRFEIGRMLIDTKGNTLEDMISYDHLQIKSSTIDAKMEEDSDLKDKIMSYLAFAIKNAMTLLQLDKVIVTGEIFQNEKRFYELERYLETYKVSDFTRIGFLEDYKEYNHHKSAITALYLYFLH